MPSPAQRRKVETGWLFQRLFAVPAPPLLFLLTSESDAETCAAVASRARKLSDNISAPQGITRKAF
jgi:hypothetical protein